VDAFYLRQLKAGRDFAVADRVAAQMVNFAYLVGDRAKGECLVVDPAWDVDGIVAAANADGMRITGALVTHYHPDHVGGAMFGMNVQGLARLLAINPCPVHVHSAEAHGVRKVTGLSATDLVEHASGDRIVAGDVEVELLHTPGHTPGSSCFRCRSALIAGDTLFLQGCGRVDLPGGDADEMRRTLSTRLATLPDDLVLYPGHDYGKQPSAPMGEVKRTNPVFRSGR
jgi:hydroxyacylglutathione hydrolase